MKVLFHLCRSTSLNCTGEQFKVPEYQHKGKKEKKKKKEKLGKGLKETQ